jgi:hypothetical protein
MTSVKAFARLLCTEDSIAEKQRKRKLLTSVPDFEQINPLRKKISQIH